jgi:serine/threonine protein kinase
MDMDLRRRPGETVSSDPDESRIQRVRVAGKSAYMAPEHARGDDVDARSDLFAAGILLWELCAGRRLYRGSDAEMLELARRGEVPPLPDRDLPDQDRLQAVLNRALCVDPAERFQSGAEMLEALEGYALGSSLMASQLRFGAFLTDHFADEIVALRRARERAAEQALHALDIPVAEVEPVTAPSEPPSAKKSAASFVGHTRRASDLAAEPQKSSAGAGRALRWVLAAIAVASVAAAVAWARF